MDTGHDRSAAADDPVGEILFFVSDEKYTRVQTEAYEALIRVPIRELVEQLDPALFGRFTAPRS